MFKTLLVPLDGSRQAESVLPVAARIAQASGATIVLARVTSFLSEYWFAMTVTHSSVTEAFTKADLEDAAAYLERVASSEHLNGITVKTITSFGPVVPTILSLAASSSSDLIVVCSHRHPGIPHWMMDSMTSRIARHASMLVLIVREDQTSLGSSPTDLAQPLRLLVPLDGSAEAEAALEPGVALLMALAAPGQQIALHLARVVSLHRGQRVDSSGGFEPPFVSRELAQAKQALCQTAEKLRKGQLAPIIAQQHLPITWSVILDNDVARAVVRVAEQGEDTEGAGVFGGCELIAVAHRGRSSFRNMVFGSITERLLHASRNSILLVRPPEPMEQESLGGGRHQTVSSGVLL